MYYYYIIIIIDRTPTYTLKTVLISLRSLLTTPEPNDPQDAQVSKNAYFIII